MDVSPAARSSLVRRASSRALWLGSISIPPMLIKAHARVGVISHHRNAESGGELPSDGPVPFDPFGGNCLCLRRAEGSFPSFDTPVANGGI